MKTIESKIQQLEINKRSKRNSKLNNSYKNTLYVITAAIALVIIVSIIFIFAGGIKVITDNDLSLGQVLFGNEFNPFRGILSMGIIVGNTIWMAFLAALIATPISIGTALIITRILNKKWSVAMYSVVSILAAIPSVVYGAFGYYVINDFATYKIGLENASLFVLVIMVAFMITPTITIMTIASINLTDSKMEDSSYALGANRTQTSMYITIRSARTGIYTGIIFAVGRCIAETTAITMIAGVSASSTTGLSLSLWQQSLFLGPALLAAQGGEVRPPFPYANLLSMFMLITTISIFAIMKFVEFKNSEIRVVKKQVEEFALEQKVVKKYDKYGIRSLSLEEQNLLIKIDNKKIRTDNSLAIAREPINSYKTLLQRSSISADKKYDDYKKTKTTQHNLFIYISAFIGIALLAGIMLFLFNGGFEYLNWETLTYRGVTKVDGKWLYGISVPMLGTYVTVIISMLVALPLGTALGVCLSTYLSKERKLGWIASYIFQLLTAIPGIVWASIASIIFAETIIHEKYITLEPIIFLMVIIMPTIIKTVEEAGGRVKRNQIEGSYALGATVATTTRKIYLREVFPSIVSGALLASSIAMAETTIFISLLPTPTGGAVTDNINDWFGGGSLTLSTLIFRLRQQSAITHPETVLEIKTIGIVLMGIILTTSYISTLVNRRKFIEASFMGAGLLFVPLGFYINEGSPLILVLAALCGVIAMFIVPMYKKAKLNKYGK